MTETFFWYDYETFGRIPRTTRPAQVAGQRTTPELELVGEPMMAYCRLSHDYLPEPEACLLTGITPQLVNAEGVSEEEFAATIERELSVPGTCAVGYNANGFDHELTRHLFYRTLRPPYEWHFKEGRSKWDIIDLARAAYALRPNGMNWPVKDDGRPSFKLSDLAKANGIELIEAHDARADVRATIALARKLRRAQPELFTYYLTLRDKHAVNKLFDLKEQTPVAYTCALNSAKNSCTTLVAPVARHPNNKNSIIVYDLRRDPQRALDWSAEDMEKYLYTKTDELPPGIARPALSEVRTNQCPFVAPMWVADDEVAARINLDVGACMRHLELLRADDGLRERVREVYASPFEAPGKVDVDHALYDGFINNKDSAALKRLRKLPSHELVKEQPKFEDERLPKLFSRYLARNHAENLPDALAKGWRRHCRNRMLEPNDADESALAAFKIGVADLAAQAKDPDDLRVLGDLASYAGELEAWLRRTDTKGEK